MGEIGFWVDFVGRFMDLGRLDFGVGVWMNQLIGILENSWSIPVFATPLYPKNHGIPIFYREIDNRTNVQ